MNLRTRVSTLAVAALLSGALAGCGSSDDTDPVAADTNTESTSSEPAPDPASDAPTTEPNPGQNTEPTSEPTSDDGGTAGTVAAPVYFVGDTPMGKRLYREFRAVAGDDPAVEALALLGAGDALDPDYGTLLPPITVESVTAADGAIVLDLGADSTTADKSMSDADGALAVQSLVYTLQGITQSRDPLRITIGGTPTPFLGQPTDTGVEAAAPLDVLSLVSVTTPESEATVSDTFTAEGVASSFEATVPWELRDESGKVVLDGFSTADGFMDKLYPWTTEVDASSLAPGSYTFAALTDDASDGEGPGPFEDTKTITIE